MIHTHFHNQLWDVIFIIGNPKQSLTDHLKLQYACSVKVLSYCFEDLGFVGQCISHLSHVLTIFISILITEHGGLTQALLKLFKLVVGQVHVSIISFDAKRWKSVKVFVPR